MLRNRSVSLSRRMSYPGCMTKRSRTETCKAHCTKCGRHFTGTTAFDAHIEREYGEHRKGWTGILSSSCGADGEDTGLAVVATGECRLGRETLVDVLILGDPKSRDRAHERFTQ